MTHNCHQEETVWEHLVQELREHLPYTVFAALTGVVLLGIYSFLQDVMKQPQMLPHAMESLFHTAHFTHLTLSAMATTALFWRREQSVIKAILVGGVGALIFCGISDIAFPLWGGMLLGVDMHAHVCVVEHMSWVLPFLSVGLVMGFVLPRKKRSSHMAHSGHVLLSTMASLFYLVSFGVTQWLPLAPFVFLFLIVAVLLPCCMSDIVFPLLFTKSKGMPSCH